jgi:hypothetical protein
MGCPSGQSLGLDNKCIPSGQGQCKSDHTKSCPIDKLCGRGDYCMPRDVNQCGNTGYYCPQGTVCTGSGSSWTCPPGPSCGPGITGYASPLTGNPLTCQGSTCVQLIEDAGTQTCSLSPSQPPPPPPSGTPPPPAAPGCYWFTNSLGTRQICPGGTPPPPPTTPPPPSGTPPPPALTLITPAPASSSLSPSPLSAPAPADAPVSLDTPSPSPSTDDFWSIEFLNLNIKWWLVIGGVVLFLLFMLILI